MGPKAVDVYQRLGRFPVGDTVTPGGESYFRWYHVDKETELKWQEDPVAWYDRHIQHVNERVAAFTRLAGDPSLRVTEVFPPEKTLETNVSIVDAIVNDKPAIFQVNIPNRGSIPGVAAGVVVEIPALVSASGIQGLHMGDLPRRIMCHLMEKVMLMERDLEAFQTGDRRMLLELILANPHTRSIEQAQGVLDEVLSLPINREMAAYYQ